MQIKIKKLTQQAIIPIKGSVGAAAYDVFIPRDAHISAGRQIIPLDFAMEIPHGYQAQIEARSGFSSKGMEGYALQNSSHFDTPEKVTRRFDADVLTGKIDSDYRGCVGVIINNHSGELFTIPAGTRIAQMTIHQVEDVLFEEVTNLSSTERGEGGFGSTGHR